MNKSAEKSTKTPTGDPSTDGVTLILDFVRNSNNLDDDALHKLFSAIGIDPHEGEEQIYSALHQALQTNPCAINPTTVEEIEPNENKGKEEKAAYVQGFLTYMELNGPACLKKEAVPLANFGMGARMITGHPLLGATGGGPNVSGPMPQPEGKKGSLLKAQNDLNKVQPNVMPPAGNGSDVGNNTYNVVTGVNPPNVTNTQGANNGTATV